MAYARIPKDLKKVKTKVAFNLTKRQIIGFSLAGIFGIPTYLFAKDYLANDVSIVIMVLVTLPFFFVTFFEKDGLYFEKYLRHIILSKFYQPKERLKKEVINFDKDKR